MLIGALSDLHGYLPEAVEPCELLLICGDVIPLRIQRNIPQSEKWLSTTFAQWVNDLPCKIVIMVGGNHDFALANMYRDRFRYASILGKPTSSKVVMLDNECYEHYDDNGELYVIWGTPYCKQFGNWAYMYEPETLKEAYATMPENCDIVLTHDAPKMLGLGEIHSGAWAGTDAGNPWLADEILRKHPKYVFCGHIHSGEHNLQTIDDIKLANVSLMDESYTPTYKPLYINVE